MAVCLARVLGGLAFLFAACGGSHYRAGAPEIDCTEPAIYSQIEVYPPGMAPQRPYRVIGAVEANWDVSSGGRLRTLQVHACEMGAHAVVAAQEETYYTGPHSGVVNVQGNWGQVTWTSGTPHTRGSALAVVYTDVAPVGPTAPVIVPAPGGPPVVVNGPPPPAVTVR